MKSFLIFVMLTTIATSASIGQQTRKFKKPETREEFLAKSKGQRTAAWILLGSGAVAIAAISPGNADFGTTGTVAVLSGAAILGSIPLFIAARKNKKRGLARPVTLYLEKTSYNSLAHYQKPGMTLRVAINIDR